jgi:hypothetical protein
MSRDENVKMKFWFRGETPLTVQMIGPLLIMKLISTNI